MTLKWSLVRHVVLSSREGWRWWCTEGELISTVARSSVPTAQAATPTYGGTWRWCTLRTRTSCTPANTVVRVLSTIWGCKVTSEVVTLEKNLSPAGISCTCMMLSNFTFHHKFNNTMYVPVTVHDIVFQTFQIPLRSSLCWSREQKEARDNKVKQFLEAIASHFWIFYHSDNFRSDTITFLNILSFR